MASKKDKVKIPALQMETPAVLVDVDAFANDISEQLDTDEKLVTFLRGLDTSMQDESRTLLMAKYLVNELRKSYERDGEEFSIDTFKLDGDDKELFAEIGIKPPKKEKAKR